MTLGADLANPAGASLTVGTTAVTLDLNGHSLSITGLPANKAGIEVGTGRSLTLENLAVAGATLVATGGSGEPGSVVVARSRVAHRRAPARSRSAAVSP